MKRKSKKLKNKSSAKTFLEKATSLALIVCLSIFLTTPLGPKSVSAYYYDEEASYGNIFATGLLDFYLIDEFGRELVGKKLLGGQKLSVTPVPEEESMPMQYEVSATSSTPVCEEFNVVTRFNSGKAQKVDLLSFGASATTTFGTWDFEFYLPLNAQVAHGDLCEADIIFHAWRAEIEDKEESGYFDTETYSLTLKAKTVSLNEVLANPDSADPAPANREFIELYNSGNAPVDIAGWEVSEISGASGEKRYPITANSTSTNEVVVWGGDTIIPPGHYAVLIFNGNDPRLNNTGDTIRLYDADEDLLDEYSYTSSSPGKSDARIPDGFGPWVDPVPTPGMPNVLEAEEKEVVIQEKIINEETQETAEVIKKEEEVSTVIDEVVEEEEGKEEMAEEMKEEEKDEEEEVVEELPEEPQELSKEDVKEEEEADKVEETKIEETGEESSLPEGKPEESPSEPEDAPADSDE